MFTKWRIVTLIMQLTTGTMPIAVAILTTIALITIIAVIVMMISLGVIAIIVTTIPMMV